MPGPEKIESRQLMFSSNGVNTFEPIPNELAPTLTELELRVKTERIREHLSQLSEDDLIQVVRQAITSGILESENLVERAWKLEIERRVKEFGGNYPPIPQDLHLPKFAPNVEYPQSPSPIEAWKDLPANLRILAERYLEKDENRQVIETPEERFWKMSVNIARAERHWGKTEEEIHQVAKEFTRMHLEKKFLANSPTLMNAGKDNGLQYSACFVLPIEDSMEGIFDSIKNAALIHKSGGGTGFALSRLRPKDDLVDSTKGKASGPISFLKVFNEATEQVRQGGTRRGANMAIMRVDHPDIEEFINCKSELDDGGNPDYWVPNNKLYELVAPFLKDDEKKRLRSALLTRQIVNFNISVGVTDKFIEAVKNDEEYELVNPRNGEVVGKRRAREIFDMMAERAHGTGPNGEETENGGDPGFVLIDLMNNSKSNPVPDIETIEATNPCGEQPLAPNDACNLGSINLGEFVIWDKDHYETDWTELERVTKLAVRFLDDVIGVNPYTLPQIDREVKANRRIGLGVMGWHDMLVKLGVAYTDKKALELAEVVMKFIQDKADVASIELAKVRGPFPNFYKSIYKDGPPMRNGTRTTIAPTGTISIIADCSSGIEPVFSWAYLHKVGERELNIDNKAFIETGIKEGFLTEEVIEKVRKQGGIVKGISEIPEDWQRVLTPVFEVDVDTHVLMQAAFQKYTDNAVSKTINLPNSATVDDVKRAYWLAIETGCKGITIYRDGSKFFQVLNLEQEEEKKEVEPIIASKNGVTEPRGYDILDGKTVPIDVPEGTKLYVTINEKNQEPFEVFTKLGKAGADIDAWAEAVARLISASLQFLPTATRHQRLAEIARQLRGIKGSQTIERVVKGGKEFILSSPDAIGIAIERYLEETRNGEGETTDSLEQKKNGFGQFCPGCKNYTLIHQEGCYKCICGYTSC